MTTVRTRRDLAVTLIEPAPTVDGRLFGRAARDLYSLVRLPARGIDLLAAGCRRGGFADTVAVNPMYGRGGRLDRGQWRRLMESDVVGISAITRTTPQSYELARLVRAFNPGALVVLGGPHGTALPDEALAHVDLVVLHEGDVSLIEVLERRFEHRETPDFSDVAGVAFRRDGRTVRTAKRPFLTNEELSALPFPVYPREVRRGITHQCITTSRGCPFECEYCSVIENFGRSFRFLSEDRTIEYLRHQLAQTRKPIFFGDDIFTASKRRTMNLMERILAEDLRLPAWSAQVRLEAAKDPEVLALMKRAGCDRVYIGIESINQATLDAWNKHATVAANTEALRRFHEAGIGVHGMFVLGGDTDTVETVRETARYARRLRLDTAQFFSITPLPGPPLTRRYEAEGKVLTHEWHLYDALHVVAQPGAMSARELQDEISRAHRRFYSWSDAVRFLLRGPERGFNAAVRVLARGVIRRVEKDGRAHRRALAHLETWRAQAEHVAQEISALYDRARAASEEALPSLARQLAEAYDEARRRLAQAYDQLAEDFRPSCEQWLDRWHQRVEGWVASLQPA